MTGKIHPKKRLKLFRLCMFTKCYGTRSYDESQQVHELSIQHRLSLGKEKKKLETCKSYEITTPLVTGAFVTSLEWEFIWQRHDGSVNGILI